MALASFVEKAVFPPLKSFCAFVKNHLSMFVWLYFWVFYSVPQIYPSGNTTLTNYYSYIISKLSYKIEGFLLFSFVRIILPIGGLYLSI